MVKQVSRPDQSRERVDFYVEQIVSYMNLDGEQHQNVARELRDYLDEAIARETAAGATPDQAETIIMDQFGTPEMLAGRLGSLKGKGWIIFESFAYALMLFAIYRIGISFNRPEFITSTHILIIAAFFGVTVFIARIWRRVQINGSLRIYLPLNPTIKLPFDSITEISMERGHLVGPRNVLIKYGRKKKIKFKSDWPNAQCIAVALQALAPQAIQPEAAEFFRRLRTKPATQPLLAKVALTVGWIALAAALAITFPLLWSGEGVSLIFSLVLMGFVFLLSLQYYSHRDRARRTMVLLLICAWAIYIPGYAVYSVMHSSGPRHLALLIAVLLPLPVLLIWWRGQNRLLLFAVFCIWIAGARIGVKNTPDNIHVPGQSLGIAHGGFRTGVLIEDLDDGVLYAALGDETKQTRNDKSAGKPMLAFIKDGETKTQTLKDGSWYFVGNGERENGLILACDNEGPEIGSRSSDFYRLGQSRTMVKVAETSNTSNLMTSQYRPEAVQSPDGQFVLTTAVDKATSQSDDLKYMLGIVNLQTGEVSRYPNLRAHAAWRWTSTTTLMLLMDKARKPKQEPTGVYEKWELDAVTGKEIFKGELNVGPGMYFQASRSDRYALLQNQTNTRFGIVDLENGTSRTLPLPEGEYPEVAWNGELNLASYMTGDHNGARQLILAGPDGVLATVPIKENYKISQVQISPDGKKVFLVATRTDSLMLPLAQLRVWDIERDNLATVGRVSWIGSSLLFLQTSANPVHPLIQWTPDSRSIIWCSYETQYKGQFNPGTQFRLNNYEDWVEKDGRKNP